MTVTPNVTTIITVRKPKAILFDFACTISKSNWIDRVVFPWLRDNVDTYLQKYWGKRVLMRDIDLLRRESVKDGGPAIPPPDQAQHKIRSAVVAYVQRCLKEVINHEAIRVFTMHMLFNGYKHDKIMTSIYSDAADCIGKWAKEKIDIHVLSNGWSYATKKFLSKTDHSDLTPHIKSFMDTKLGSLESSATYKAVVEKFGLPGEDILFFTHSGMEGVAAHQAGLSVILVATHREDVLRERTEITIQCGLPYVRILTDVIFANDAPVASSMVDKEAMSKTASALKGQCILGPMETDRSANVGKSSTSLSTHKSKSSSSFGGIATSKGSSKSSSSSPSNTKSSTLWTGKASAHGASTGPHSSNAAGSFNSSSCIKVSSIRSESKSSDVSTGEPPSKPNH